MQENLLLILFHTSHCPRTHSIHVSAALVVAWRWFFSSVYFFKCVSNEIVIPFHKCTANNKWQKIVFYASQLHKKNQKALKTLKLTDKGKMLFFLSFANIFLLLFINLKLKTLWWWWPTTNNTQCTKANILCHTIIVQIYIIRNNCKKKSFG